MCLSKSIFVSKRFASCLVFSGVSSNSVYLLWAELATALLPHLLFPPNETYRLTMISYKKITLLDWIKQDNCEMMDIVGLDEGDLSADAEKTSLFSNSVMKIERLEEGLRNVSIPTCSSEWEAYFKLYVLDYILIKDKTVVIHFSTSIYSKLIINCIARVRSLSLEPQEGWVKKWSE